MLLNFAKNEQMRHMQLQTICQVVEEWIGNVVWNAVTRSALDVMPPVHLVVLK